MGRWRTKNTMSNQFMLLGLEDDVFRIATLLRDAFEPPSDCRVGVFGLLKW
jgi:hypothetical protein